MLAYLKGISPKLIAAIAVPFAAVVSQVIVTGRIDRESIAAIATLAIGALAGYHAPVGAVKFPELDGPYVDPIMAGTMGPSGPGMVALDSAVTPDTP